MNKMKLVDLLHSIYEKTIFDNQDYSLGPKELNLIKNELLQCEEFENVDELIIMDAPNGEFKNRDGSSFNVCSAVQKFMKGTKYKGTCYLYSISLSPKFYNSPLSSVKDNVGFIPEIINKNTYKKESKIVISYPCDASTDDLKTILQNLVNNLDKLVEYKLPEERSIGIRGFFLEENHEPNSKELVVEDNKPVVKEVYRPEPEVIVF